VTVNPGFFERFNVRLWITTTAATISTDFTAAVAYENEFIRLLKRGHIRDVARTYAAAAKEANV
jgi:hypothetical protein